MAENGEGNGPPRDSRGLSRRDLLRGGAAVGLLGTGLLRAVPSAEGAVAAKTGAGAEIVGPGPVAMNFRINGQAMSARLEPRVTLLDALRTRFELTGAKRVCDRGTCGACTVLMDGKTVYACSVLAVDAQDAEIQTVEGLGTVERLAPLQAAFVENAAECGFCAPGFVVAAKALLDSNPNPTIAEVHHGLSGNLCRCGAYAGIRQAVLQVARTAVEEPERAPELEAPPVVDEEKATRALKHKKKKGKKKPGRGGGDGGS